MAVYVKVLGARLRDVRPREGLSLQRVEQRSGGRWKAVVVSSYERGDRAVTAQKLAELARFYGVPMSELVRRMISAPTMAWPPPSCSTSIVSTRCPVEKPDRWPGTPRISRTAEGSTHHY